MSYIFEIYIKTVECFEVNLMYFKGRKPITRNTRDKIIKKNLNLRNLENL